MLPTKRIMRTSVSLSLILHVNYYGTIHSSDYKTSETHIQRLTHPSNPYEVVVAFYASRVR
jgi:hypothetical protein